MSDEPADVTRLLRLIGEGDPGAETAAALEPTVKEDWMYARAWMHRELKKGLDASDSDTGSAGR